MRTNMANQRTMIREHIREGALAIFGKDHDVNIEAVVSHALETRSLTVGETLLLGHFLTYAAEQTLEAKASAGK
jgi:hypothetical protein